MNDNVVIQRTGFYTSIQDSGRFGYAHLGIPESGVMDVKAMQLANLLVNNKQNDAVLEFTLVGPAITFCCTRHFVITGGTTVVMLDGKEIKNNVVYVAHNGQILEITKVTKGCRGYLAIAGGLQSKEVLQSKSMYTPITKEATLKKGIHINIGTSNYGTVKGAKLNKRAIVEATSYLTESQIEVYKGPEFHLLDQKLVDTIFNTTFTVSKLWNRMAIQLEQTLSHNIPSITTGPVLPGTIQLTPSGRMMLLMKDCQTTGGYPRILQISGNALSILVQKKQHNEISLILRSQASV